MLRSKFKNVLIKKKTKKKNEITLLFTYLLILYIYKL